MSVANLYFVPLCFLLVVISIVIISCFLKFGSLRNYRRKQNWLIYAIILLTVGLLAFQINEQLLGAPMVHIGFEAKPFYANQLSSFEVTVESLSRRETSFNLIIAAVNASLIADSQGCIQVNATAIKIPIQHRVIHEEVDAKVFFRMDENVSGCAFNTEIEPVKSRPFVSNSLEGAISIWDNNTHRYTLKGIYGPYI